MSSTRAKIIFASSSSVYGGNSAMPFNEADPVGEPLSLYAATKRANELNAHVYSELYGIRCIGLRFFTVYGPWYRPDMALSLFADAMLKGLPVPIFNGGDLKRDFTYIDDVVAGITGCIECRNLGRFELLNLGSSRAERLMDIVNLLAKELAVDPVIKFLPMQSGDMKETWSDIGRIASKTGYNPEFTISEGIPRFVEWYRGYYLE